MRQRKVVEKKYVIIKARSKDECLKVWNDFSESATLY